MAVTVTPVYAGSYTKTWDIIASADADVAAVIAHGFGIAPVAVWMTPLDTDFYVSTWTLGVIDATNINLAKANAVGSGNPAAQLRVTAMLPHSLIA